MQDGFFEGEWIHGGDFPNGRGGHSTIIYPSTTGTNMFI